MNPKVKDLEALNDDADFALNEASDDLGGKEQCPTNGENS